MYIFCPTSTKYKLEVCFTTTPQALARKQNKPKKTFEKVVGVSSVSHLRRYNYSFPLKERALLIKNNYDDRLLLACDIRVMCLCCAASLLHIHIYTLKDSLYIYKILLIFVFFYDLLLRLVCRSLFIVSVSLCGCLPNSSEHNIFL